MHSVVLTLTNSSDATADYLCGVAHQQGIAILRLNTDRPLSDVSIKFSGDRISLTANKKFIVPRCVSTVWRRRPTPLSSAPPGDSVERLFLLNEWTEAFESFLALIPVDRWINHPTCNAMASSKLEQITRAASHGLRVPDTILTQDVSKALDCWERWNGNMVVKPLSSGYLERTDGPDGLLYTNRVDRNDIQNSADLPQCPTLFQQAIEKTLDVRITVVDSAVHAIGLKRTNAAGIQIQDVRRDNMQGVQYVPIDVPTNVHASLMSLLGSYSLRFAAVDFVIDCNDEWFFLEINPNGQWAWLDLAGATRIAESFVDAFLADKERGGCV